eukprot:5905854-Amphidinium_carterae.1
MTGSLERLSLLHIAGVITEHCHITASTIAWSGLPHVLLNGSSFGAAAAISPEMSNATLVHVRHGCATAGALRWVRFGFSCCMEHCKAMNAAWLVSPGNES